jgi:hypothetical protein
MSLPSDHQFRRRSCAGKKRYSSYVLAYAAQEGHAETFGETLEVYFCHFCRGIHLGHHSKEVERRKGHPLKNGLKITQDIPYGNEEAQRKRGTYPHRSA